MRKIVFFMFIISNIIFSKTFILGVSENVPKLPKYKEVVDMLALSFKDVGYEIKIEPYPIERSLQYLEDGKIDGEFPRLKERASEFKNIIVVNEPIIVNKIFLYTISQNSAEINNKKVGILFGNKRLKSFLQKKYKNIIVLEFKDVNSIGKALMIDRIDYGVFYESYGELLLKDFSKKGMKKLEKPIGEEKAYLFLNKRYENIKKDLEKAILKHKKI